jgi:hypothetical protein
MQPVNIQGVQTTITVRPVAGGKRWTWEFHCENGLSGRNTQDLCPSRASAWDEGRSAAYGAITTAKREHQAASASTSTTSV